jgi:proteasome lid subunit RPN8/RPN11
MAIRDGTAGDGYLKVYGIPEYASPMKKWLTKLLGLEKEAFQDVYLTKKTVAAIEAFAKKAYPREFTAYLKGKVRKGSLVIDGLLYQHFASDEGSAEIGNDLPITSGAVGLVHSHPNNDARPSKADKRTFAKTGICHGIIARPYRPNDLVIYDGHARLLPWQMKAR